MLFLLDLPKGEEVTILAQKKKDGKYGEEGDVRSHVEDHTKFKVNGRPPTCRFYPISVSADRGVRCWRLFLHPDAL